jgi:osmoprotectant transport system permease protein
MGPCGAGGGYPVNLFIDAILWIFSPDRLGGFDPLPLRLGEHIGYTVVSVLIGALVAIPLGWYIGHTGRGRELAVGLSGAARAVPSFGLIILLVLVIGTTRAPIAATITFVLLAIPPILAGAYAGLEAIDRRIIDAARAVGMTGWQILWKVEVPLGLPLLIGGLRSAALQVVATVTLAATVGLGALGIYIIAGIQLRQFDEVLGGAILIAGLALLTDLLFALLQRVVVPRGVTAGRAKDVRTSSSRRRAVVETPTERE